MEITRKMILTAWKKPSAEHLVELEFDLERALKYLGEKAYRNKSKKTKLGYVTVKVRPTAAGQAAIKAAAKPKVSDVTDIPLDEIFNPHEVLARMK